MNRKFDGVDEKKVIDVLEMIAKDQENDAMAFEGKPFNGRTIAEYFGNQGAAIAALANIVELLIAHRAPSQKEGGIG